MMDDLLFDLDQLLILPVHKYKNKTFLITGSTGLIGSLIIKSLLFLNEKCQLNLSVIAVIRNLEKAKIIFADCIDDDSLEFVIADLSEAVFITDKKIDFIVHAASVTTSKYMISNPVETIKTSVVGTEIMLEEAVKNRVEGMVYLSSMEVYGKPCVDRVAETDLGYIDLLNVRSCYPESKRICEMLCVAFSEEYNVPVCIARLAQTFGAGILPTENRVFAQFARSVINEKNIVLHTKGQSEGNYVYTFDAVKAILLLLTNGNSGEPYNISNEASHTTIRGMAEMVAHEIANDRIDVVIDIPNDNPGYAQDVKMWMNSSKIRDLGWDASVGLEEAYRRMISWMNSSSYKTMEEQMQLGYHENTI